jgi:hypothetical protein
MLPAGNRNTVSRTGSGVSGVEDPQRVEGAFHPLQEGIAGVTDHAADEFPAQPAVAVLAAERAPVFLHEHRHVRGHVAKHPQSLRRAQVEERPQVQFARPGVRIVHAVDAVFLGQQPVELGDVRRQVLHGHRRVFDDLPRLGVTGHVVEQTLSSPAEFPYLGGLGPEERGEGKTEARHPQFRGQGVELAGERRRVGVPQFHHQHRPRIAHHERTVPRLPQIVPRAVEDLSVDQFAGGGAIRGGPVSSHDHERRPQRFIHRLAVHAEERPRGR